MAGHADLTAAAHLRDADIDRLADRLYRIKAAAYRDALKRAQARHGGERQRVVLSEAIRLAIRQEAETHARMSVQTINRMIDRFAARHHDTPREVFIPRFAEFMRDLGERRGRVVGNLAPLTARLDAEVTFYRENGVDPEFDFTGPPAVCSRCKALKAGGPYSVEEVLEVGYPHLGCRHNWRARTRAREALKEGGVRPGTISAGRGEPAGILGMGSLDSRFGGEEEALRVIESLG